VLSYAEDLLNAVETFTESNLATYLTAIETEKGDSVTPSNLNGVEVGVYDPSKYNNFPLGFLLPLSEEYEPLSMGSDELTLTAELWVIDRGYDEATLTTRVARFAAALRNMVRSNMDLGSTIGEIRFNTAEYFPRVYGVEDAQGARVTLTIIQEV